MWTLGYVLRYAGLMEESMASYRRSQELDSTAGNLVSAQDQITKSLIYLGDYDAARDGHAAARPRKLLLHRREIARLFGMVQREGVTLVPLSLYFNPRGIAKVELAVARGKRKYDKRETIKERDWKRDKARLMRERG